MSIHYLLASFLILSSFNLSAQSSEQSRFDAAAKLYNTIGGYGCATCHGSFAHGGGNVGGNIRGKTLQHIDSSLVEEPTMKLLSNALSDQDKQELAFYLQELDKLTLVEWTIDDKKIEQSQDLEVGKKAQLVVVNKRFESISIDLSSLQTGASMQLEPYQTKSFQWTVDKQDLTLTFKQNRLNIKTKSNKKDI